MRQSIAMKWALTTPIVWNWLDEAYLDDYKLTVEDLDETVFYGALLAGLWNEEIFTYAGVSLGLPLGYMALAGATTAAVGFAPAYLIAGEEGAKDYGDFIYSGPMGMYEKTVEVTIPTLAPRLIQELYKKKVEAEGLVSGFINWADKKLEEAKQGLPSWSL